MLLLYYKCYGVKVQILDETLINQIRPGLVMKTKQISGILAIVAGVLVLAMPSFLKWIVALFLIVYGILNLK